MADVIYGGFAPTHGQTLGQVVISDYDFPLELLNFSWTGLHRDKIPVTNMNVQPTTGSGLGNMMYIPSAYIDPGELELKVLHNPLVRIPITDPTKSGPTDITFKIGPAATNQEVFDGLGFVTDYTPDGPLDGTALTATVKIALTDLVDNTYDAEGAISCSVAN